MADTKDQAAARANLAMLTPGQTVYTVLRHVSGSGMTRHISLYVVDDGKIRDVTWDVGRLLGYRRNRDNGGLVVQGCGMDMGFDLVYNLGYALYPSGYICTGETPRCRHNDHSNPPMPARNGAWHHGASGYVFSHEWL